MLLKSLSLIIIISLLSVSNFTHIKGNFSARSSDTIIWSSMNKLCWADFTGVPDDPKFYVKASTASGIYMIRVGSIRKFHYSIKSIFVKSRSWTKVKDEYNLKHEQLHFDISELFARKLRKSVDSLIKMGIKDKIIFKKAYNENFAKMDDYQDRYDNEVYYDEVNQNMWFGKIALELNNLKEYQAD